MKTVAIIQARMGSTRLPGKVLMDIAGRTMLARVVRRTQRTRLIDEVVIATTELPADDAIVTECARLGSPVFRGDERDVVDRYYRTAVAHRAELVVRITADCPLIDASEAERVIVAFNNSRPDYASNAILPTLPRGLDTEVFTMGALESAWSEANAPYQRAHVTPFIYEHPERFRLLSVPFPPNFGQHRWTVDTSQDLEFVRAVYARLGEREEFGWLDVIELLKREPALSSINRHIKQKSLMDG